MQCNECTLWMQRYECNIMNARLWMQLYECKVMNLLIILGGSEPPLGSRGRSILMYTSYNISVSFCDAPECIFDAHSGKDSRMVYCDSIMCKRWIHIYCDLSIRSKKKLPEKYHCPLCTCTKK